MDYDKLKTLYDTNRNINKERAKLAAKRKLMKMVESNFTTTLIGVLARCENNLGDLWGQGLDYCDLTKAQREMRDLWEVLRSEILNHGNSHKRIVLEQLNQYDVEWKNYHIDFIVKKDGME
jgi:hypothetical protein